MATPIDFLRNPVWHSNRTTQRDDGKTAAAAKDISKEKPDLI